MFTLKSLKVTSSDQQTAEECIHWESYYEGQNYTKHDQSMTVITDRHYNRWMHYWNVVYQKWQTSTVHKHNYIDKTRPLLTVEITSYNCMYGIYIRIQWTNFTAYISGSRIGPMLESILTDKHIHYSYRCHRWYVLVALHGDYVQRSIQLHSLANYAYLPFSDGTSSFSVTVTVPVRGGKS